MPKGMTFCPACDEDHWNWEPCDEQRRVRAAKKEALMVAPARLNAPRHGAPGVEWGNRLDTVVQQGHGDLQVVMRKRKAAPIGRVTPDPRWTSE